MQNSALPDKFPVPWANNAGPSYIKSIPQPSQIGILDGAASLEDGFPPLTMTPIGAGGKPPWGQDTNGILKWITEVLQWYQAGGTCAYDGIFSTDIGGYPAGALLRSTGDADLLWMNTADNNTTNPDSSGTSWSAATFPSGTRMLFQQSTAPTGWTKDTTHNDKALRVVSGTASSGGTVAFSTAFASITPTGTVAGHVLTAAENGTHSHVVTDPTHSHTLTSDLQVGGSSPNPGFLFNTSMDSNYANAGVSKNTTASGSGISIQNSGSGTAHSHGWTGNAINLAVAYVDLIIASKN